MYRAWLCVSVGASVMLVAGCGAGAGTHNVAPPTSSTDHVSVGSAGGDNSTIDPSNLIKVMFDAVQAATSFRVAGSGVQRDGTAYKLEVHFSGDGGSGYFSEGAAHFDLAGRAGNIYVKTSAAAWSATIGARPDADKNAAVLAGKWVKVPANDRNFAQLVAYVDKDSFVKSFAASAASGSGPFEKSGLAKVDGTDAVVFTDTKDQSKIYIAAHSAPVLLKVEGSAKDGGGSGGTLTIGDYNMPFEPMQPPADEVIDYTSVVR